MTQASVLLVRHGRTPHNAQRRFLGHRDVGLDDVGRVQARMLSRHPDVLARQRLVCSPLGRARQTAAYLGPVDEIASGLAELDQGRLEGLQPDEAVARFPDFFMAWARDPTHVRTPGGETLGEARDRCLAVFLALHEATPEGLVVVSHDVVLAALCATLEGHPLAAWRRFMLPHGSARRLERTRRGWRLRASDLP